MAGSGSARGVVLIVEDEQTIAELLLRYLHREGYEVHHETDGAAALKAIRRLRPSRNRARHRVTVARRPAGVPRIARCWGYHPHPVP